VPFGAFIASSRVGQLWPSLRTTLGCCLDFFDFLERLVEGFIRIDCVSSGSEISDGAALFDGEPENLASFRDISGSATTLLRFSERVLQGFTMGDIQTMYLAIGVSASSGRRGSQVVGSSRDFSTSSNSLNGSSKACAEDALFLEDFFIKSNSRNKDYAKINPRQDTSMSDPITGHKKPGDGSTRVISRLGVISAQKVSTSDTRSKDFVLEFYCSFGGIRLEFRPQTSFLK
jgi:hypothetical protein